MYRRSSSHPPQKGSSSSSSSVRALLFMEVNYFHFRRHIHRNSHNMDLVCCLWLTQIRLGGEKWDPSVFGLRAPTSSRCNFPSPHTHPCAQPPPHFPNWHSCSSVMEKLDLSGDIVSRAYPNIASVVHWGPAAAAVIHSKPPHIDIHTYAHTYLGYLNNIVRFGLRLVFLNQHDDTPGSCVHLSSSRRRPTLFLISDYVVREL